jgi:membrane protease subunit HflK
MHHNFKKIGLINWIVLLLAGAISGVIAQLMNSDSGWLATAILAIGFFVGLVSYFQMRLEEREAIEQLEYEELNKSKGGSALFTSQEADVFPARRSRVQYERFFIPAFTVFLVVLEAAVIVWRWREIPNTIPVTGRGALGMSLYALLGLVLFVFGRYSAGLTRLEGQRLLRPVAGFSLFGAYACFITTGVLAAVEGGFPQFDGYAAKLLCVALGLVTVESVLALIFEIYRPRVKGKALRLLYDSRLVGLFGQPEGIFTAAAQALDYQFGFKVSDTWFYQFIRRRLGLLLAIQVAVLLASTTVVFIDPGEQGLLERFGTKVESRPVLEPGLHLKWPWPIDEVRRYETSRLQSFSVGYVPDPAREQENLVLWTVGHTKEEFNLLVASSDPMATNSPGSVPVSLLTVSIPVQYQIGDVRAFAYNYTDAARLLELIATREVVRYLVGVDLNDVMSAERAKAADTLRQRIQARADELKLGVQIIFIGLQDIHPPVKVAKAYQDVVGARQEIEAKILVAEAYRAKMVPQAEGESLSRVRAAEAYRLTRQANSGAEAGQFTNQVVAFNAAPSVYPQRLYLQTLGKATEAARKYVIASTNSAQVIQLNLEDKIRPDYGRIAVPSANK